MPFYLLVSLIFSSVFCQIKSFPASESDLRQKYGNVAFSSVFIRPGLRSPLATYPTDANKHHPWPQGYGQLTRTGYSRLYQNGKWLKKRYEEFLGSEYNRSEILVHSSDLDRTIMSAQLLLYGMYPATNSSVWLKGEKWQPIPIVTIPTNQDNMIQMSQPCPRLDQLLERIFSSSQIQQIFNDQKENLQFIDKNTGLNLSLVSTNVELYKILEALHDTLYHERVHNLHLSAWTVEKKPFVEYILKDIVKKVRKIVHSHYEVNKLYTGMFVKSVISEMQEKRDNPLNKLKVHLYSGPDINLEAILASIAGVEKYDAFSAEGAMLLFELRKKEAQYYVTFSYRLSDVINSYVVQIPGCPTVCTFDQFKDLIRRMVPDDWNIECQISLNVTTEISSSKLTEVTGIPTSDASFSVSTEIPETINTENPSMASTKETQKVTEELNDVSASYSLTKTRNYCLLSLITFYYFRRYNHFLNNYVKLFAIFCGLKLILEHHF